MKTTQKINGITVKVEVENWTAERFRKFPSLEKAVEHMTNNEVLHGGYSIGGFLTMLSIEQTDEAVANWVENEMRIPNKHFPQPDLPTDMYK